jgi:lipoprotein-anchoring transpeptidase ErfK/SrfK
VDLTYQTLTAYEGRRPVFHTRVSSGLPQYPTVVGTFSIYLKYELADMSGGAGDDAYYLPGVPYVMYFHGNYGLHGTYWHNNFGQPMSHGCVNLPTADAEWLFNWAPIGARVVTHY